MKDIIEFNRRLADYFVSGSINGDQISNLPDIATPGGLAVMNEMSICAVKLAHSLGPLQHSLLYGSQAGNARFGALRAQALKTVYQEWLELARIKSMAVLAGNYADLLRMHLSWQQAEWISSLSRGDVDQIASRTEPRLLAFARPRLFDAAVKIHPSLYAAYSVLP